MFDIGFWEIAVIAVVALLVVGPNEFPRLVHNVAVWIGKLRRFMSETKNDLDQEFRKMEELKEHLEEEAKIVERHLNEDLSEHISMRSVAASSPSIPAAEQTSLNDNSPADGDQSLEGQPPENQPLENQTQTNQASAVQNETAVKSV